MFSVYLRFSHFLALSFYRFSMVTMIKIQIET
jgi:hypothetical protein